jgi:hypothetical protein
MYSVQEMYSVLYSYRGNYNLLGVDGVGFTLLLQFIQSRQVQTPPCMIDLLHSKNEEHTRS